MLRMKFSAKNPPLHKAAKRSVQEPRRAKKLRTKPLGIQHGTKFLRKLHPQLREQPPVNPQEPTPNRAKPTLRGFLRITLYLRKLRFATTSQNSRPLCAIIKDDKTNNELE